MLDGCSRITSKVAQRSGLLIYLMIDKPNVMSSDLIQTTKVRWLDVKQTIKQ